MLVATGGYGDRPPTMHTQTPSAGRARPPPFTDRKRGPMIRGRDSTPEAASRPRMIVTSVSHTGYLSDHGLRRPARRARSGVKSNRICGHSQGVPPENLVFPIVQGLMAWGPLPKQGSIDVSFDP